MKISNICLFGGSGFVGRHLAAELSRRGYHIRIPVRRPHRCRHLQVLPNCTVTEITDLSLAGIEAAIGNSDAIINLIGILNSSRQTSFQQVHVDLVSRIIDVAHQSGIKRLLHMSALNADESSGKSRYLRSKGEGENRAHTNGRPHIAVTSFKPSVIFGADDSFINRFHALMKIPGPLPLACPQAKFAPIFVGDVAKAFANALENSQTFAHSYELCGPRIFTLRQIVDYIAKHNQQNKAVIELGDTLSRFQAKLLGIMPGRPFTMDNYLSLQSDSLCTQNGLVALGVTATDMDVIVPDMFHG